MSLRFFTLFTGLALLAVTPLHAAPLKVGSGNEAVIEPPVPHPNDTPCVVPLVTGGMFGADPVVYTYKPPKACPGPWGAVVLSLEISLNQGRQFDRTGALFMNGVPLYFGTTAEPRATLAPNWHIERDVTGYSALLGSKQTGYLQIPNYQSSVYTSTITASASLLFYPPTTAFPAPATADVVLPVPSGGGLGTLGSGTDTISTDVALPRNILRAKLDLYLQGQSTDEFWYTCVPSAVAGELETCGNTAYREGEISIDGVPAGVAPVFPWIFTGGIDPYLWQPVPGVQTFVFKPFTADLSPFAGVLSDGKTHSIAASVYNADSYFAATGALRLFLDHNAKRVTGGITRNTLAAMPQPQVTQNLTTTDGTTSGTIGTRSQRSFIISGTVVGSAGTITHSVQQTTSFRNNQNLLVNGNQDKQDVVQDTYTTIVSTERSPTATVTTERSLDYPLTVKYNFLALRNGEYQQTTSVTQAFLEFTNGLDNGAITHQDSLTNSIDTTDQLYFDSNFSSIGHIAQAETASYARTGTTLPCFERTINAYASVITGIETGCR